MAFEGLTEKISSAFKHLRSKGRLTESDIKEAMREIRMALLEADVNFKVVKEFVAKTKERCMTAEVMESLSPAQNVVKIVLDELTEMLGSTESKLVFSNRIPNVIMLVGLPTGDDGYSVQTSYVPMLYLTPDCTPSSGHPQLREEPGLVLHPLLLPKRHGAGTSWH